MHTQENLDDTSNCRRGTKWWTSLTKFVVRQTVNGWCQVSTWPSSSWLLNSIGHSSCLGPGGQLSSPCYNFYVFQKETCTMISLYVDRLTNSDPCSGFTDWLAKTPLILFMIHLLRFHKVGKDHFLSFFYSDTIIFQASILNKLKIHFNRHFPFMCIHPGDYTSILHILATLVGFPIPLGGWPSCTKPGYFFCLFQPKYTPNTPDLWRRLRSNWINLVCLSNEF